MADPRILVHVGYHKTATTWLQKVYFPQHEGIASPFKRVEISKTLVLPHPFTFDPARARNLLMERIQPALDAGHPVVLSNERLTGNPASGGIDAYDMVDRLVQVLPEARVWLSFREQTSIVNSYYNQFIKQGGTCSPEAFLDGNPPHKRIPHFSLNYFHYLPLIQRFEDRFGSNNVMATAFEEFKQDRDGVLDRVGKFAGFQHDPEIGAQADPANVSLSDRSIRMLRILNGVFTHRAAHKHYRPLFRLPGNHTVVNAMVAMDRVFGRRGGKIKQRIKDDIGDYFATSNRALADHLGLDLEQWGYQVADQPAVFPRTAATARVRTARA